MSNQLVADTPGIARVRRRAMFPLNHSHGIDDISGTDVDGVIMTDTQVLDRVRATGSFALTRGPAYRLRRSDWLVDIAALADMRGMRISLRDTGRVILVLDVDWAGWAPDDGANDDYTDEPLAQTNHPSRGRGPRLVPEM